MTGHCCRVWLPHHIKFGCVSRKLIIPAHADMAAASLILDESRGAPEIARHV